MSIALVRCKLRLFGSLKRAVRKRARLVGWAAPAARPKAFCRRGLKLCSAEAASERGGGATRVERAGSKRLAAGDSGLVARRRAVAPPSVGLVDQKVARPQTHPPANGWGRRHW